MMVKSKRSRVCAEASIADETLGRKETKHNETVDVWKAFIAALGKLGLLQSVVEAYATEFDTGEEKIPVPLKRPFVGRVTESKQEVKRLVPKQLVRIPRSESVSVQSGALTIQPAPFDDANYEINRGECPHTSHCCHSSSSLEVKYSLITQIAAHP